jgi:ferritin
LLGSEDRGTSLNDEEMEQAAKLTNWKVQMERQVRMVKINTVSNEHSRPGEHRRRDKSD